jgi:hypothetical protein
MKTRFASHAMHIGILLLVLFSACNGQRLKTEEEKERDIVLKNQIKSITEHRTNIYLGQKQQEQITQVKSFNKAGLKIHEVDFTSQGDTDLLFTYEYDSNNNLLLATAVNKSNQLMSKAVRTYDKNNNRKELYHYLPDGTYKYRTVSTYDKQGRITELSWYWTTGFKSKNVYAYEGLNKISDTEYSAEGNQAYQWKYKYDSRNNLVEAAQYYPGNILTQKITYEYNATDQLIKQSNYQNDHIEKYITFQYDSRGLLSTKTEYSSSGKPTAIFRYDYEITK